MSDEMCTYCGSALDEPDAYGHPDGPICSEACYFEVCEEDAAVGRVWSAEELARVASPSEEQA